MNLNNYKLKLRGLALMLLMGFSTAQHAAAQLPETPLPNQNRYATELFRIETPDPFDRDQFLNSELSIQQLFENADNRIHAYPVMYSEMGKLAVCDQTESTELIADYNLKNGVAIPVHRTYELGIKAEIQIESIRQNTVTYALDFKYNVLKGYDEFVLKDEIKGKRPYFETRQIVKELKQSLGSWLVLGGFSSSNVENVQSTYYVIRITKPISSNSF